MRGKLLFVCGLAAGFVLGARAGREKYEDLVVKGRKFLDHPTVQEAAGVAQAQATRLYSEGKDRLSQTKLGEKLSAGGNASDRKHKLTAADDAFAGTAASRSGSAPTAAANPRPKPPGAGTNATTY